MNKELEKYILKIIKKYKPKLFLERHTIDVEYREDNDYLSCQFHYPYLDTTIYYSSKVVKAFKEKRYKDLEAQIVHELCHIITDPFYSKALDRYVGKNEIEDERENLTDLISKIVLNV